MARPNTREGLISAVVEASKEGRRVKAAGSGHSFTGAALTDGTMLRLESLDRVLDVDRASGRVKVEAGITLRELGRRLDRLGLAQENLGDVDRQTLVHGLAAVLGFVSATGIAVLTVGGGFGYLTRRHGWTCDTVTSMEVVTADGLVKTASAEENEDLFWALRGGSGNFGIVTSFEYRLFPVGPEILGGAIAWHGADAKEVLDAFRLFSAEAPRELTSVGVLRIAPPAPWLPKEVHGKPIVAIFVCHAGKIEEGEALVARLRKVGKPIADIVTRRPYTQMQSLLDATQPKGRRYYWKSHYLPGITGRAIDIAVEHAGRIRPPHSAIIFFQILGALGELPADHSPAGNRDAHYVLNITGSWEKPEDDDVNIQWARDCFEASRSLSTGGTYVNFLTEEEGRDRIEAAYGRSTLERLAALKRKHDPENLFRHTKQVLS
jgi:FAD/FMN-containing dehydrogenase